MQEKIDYSTKAEKLIIVGAAASGKDFLINFCIEKGLLRGMKWTTRPPRKGEINGVDYNFIDSETFKEMISEESFHEWETFNIGDDVWYYGSTWEDFNNGQVFIKTPTAVAKLTEEQRKNSFVVYLDIPLDVRRNRLIDRLSELNDTDSFERRISGDSEDFLKFSDYDMRINDADFDPDMILSFLE